MMNAYKKETGVQRRRQFIKRPGFQIAILTVLALAVAALSIWNAAGLQSLVKGSTKAYVQDVSYQLAKDIDQRLSNITRELKLLEDSLMGFDSYEDTDELKGYLGRKADILGFEKLILLSPDGKALSTGEMVPDIWEQPGIQQSLEGKNGVTVLREQGLLYSIPLHTDGRISGVLAGVHSKINMQKLIQPHSFSGEGLTCISDLKGRVVISPAEVEPFLQLDSIFLREPGTSEKTAQDIDSMMENMENRRDGVLSFTAVDGSELILSYNILETYDWVLLTLVPEDLISSGTGQYILRTFWIVAGTVLMFGLILALLLYSHRSHRRELERIAFSDSVTGGPNNAAFQFRGRELLDNAAAGTYAIVCLYGVNINRINEQYGVTARDEVICQIDRILRSHIRDGELAARGESAYFYLCLRESDKTKIQQRLDRMTQEIERFSRESAYPLSLREGAYLVEDPSLEIAVLQDRAKAACHTPPAKGAGGCVFFDAEVVARIQQKQELADSLDQALENREFQVYLQPKVCPADGRLAGAEALVRWQHSRRGSISPAEFIPLFEESGAICKLDFYMFEEICRLQRRWRETGGPHIPISVNLSRLHFQNPDFLQEMGRIAAQYGVSTGSIELELTESTFFDDQDIQVVKGCIREMHRLGFLCSLDDFGSGFSSLGLLKEFEVDAIKLDRRFFEDISLPKARSIISGIIGMAGDLGVTAVAEGIETAEQLDFLRGVHCDLVQGYIYSKPIPVSTFEEWAAGRDSSAP
jgi:EAL domain-containing protein (putative c-di-GMP-specific phosphodiesterase class I)/GGDEF domain-containing protein